MLRYSTILSVCLVAILPNAAFAYIGPGLGAGALGVVLGVIGSIFLALFAELYYPIKRVVKRRRANANPDEDVEKSV